jgi:hypothetical protein
VPGDVPDLLPQETCTLLRIYAHAGMLAVPRPPAVETAVASGEVLPDGPILSSTTGCSIPGVPSYIRPRGGTSADVGPPSGAVSLEGASQNV